MSELQRILALVQIVAETRGYPNLRHLHDQAMSELEAASLLPETTSDDEPEDDEDGA